MKDIGFVVMAIVIFTVIMPEKMGQTFGKAWAAFQSASSCQIEKG